MAASPSTAATILAVDLGRFKSIACVDDRATRAATFATLDTGRGVCGRWPTRAGCGAAGRDAV